MSILKTLKCKVLGDSDEVANLKAELAVAKELVALLEDSNTGLTSAFGLLQQKYQQDLALKELALACLLTVAGGQVTVTNDTVKAVNAEPFAFDYDSDEHTVTIKLVEPEPERDDRDADADHGDRDNCPNCHAE